MLDKIRHFIIGVSVNRVGKLGIMLTTSVFIIFIFLEILRLMGVLTNTYIGLITYLLFPALFVIGLILILIGWKKYQKQTGKTTSELLKMRFDESDLALNQSGSNLFRTIIILTIVNIVFISAASYRMLHFMDQSNFCGTACHRVMNPEWVTYQKSPHARVKCVECHVGEGAEAVFDAKLNGIWQMISVTFNLFEQPIPTPIRNLRPAMETCEKCHWPDKFYGKRLKSIVHFDTDENSTPKYSTLNLKIDAGSGSGAAGIHWHISSDNEVRYASVDDERIDMIWVEVKQSDGSYKRYENRELSGLASESSSMRIMDCVDCHNRATHIYEEPDAAIDERMRLGLLDRSLPFLKKVAMEALNTSYRSHALAEEGIENTIRSYYLDNYRDIYQEKSRQIDSVILVLQEIYIRNIHPNMNITWSSYNSHIGHRTKEGCMRCHSVNLVDESGQSISNDCTLCHSILSNEESEPFKYLMPADTSDRNYDMHQYLRDEFLKSGEL